ncbi:ATP-binding protein (plasmid) [Pseudoalteromonas sp. T1lg65]|uniref:ATP-binding protein n=1 Tax=Pseudoalteromonas sp. T1lg65 TaxID=2077101 RepID=UPI003F7B23AA
MLKLLLSLYLAVFTSIVVINQVNEAIWARWVTSSTDDLRHAKSVIYSLQPHLDAETLSTIDNVTLLNINDVAWLDEQAKIINSGKILESFDQQGNAWLTFKLKESEQLMRLGPFAPEQSSALKQQILKFLSFSLLALLLVFWIRPLWLDLLHLKYITEQLSKGKQPEKQRHFRFSAISTITAQIKALADQVARLIDNQKQLVNAVSHDLRTPLARLKFALAMLPPVAQPQAADMQEDIKEMEHLIDEMLSYARLEFEVENQHFLALNLSELVQQQVDKFQSFSNKIISCNITSNIKVLGHQSYLGRAIQNLLTNANKFSYQRYHVELTIDEQRAILTISDDGPGVEESHRESIFSPFKRIEDSRNKSLGGYGLGLAIVRKIVNWHFGNCYVTDSHLGGACFTIALPLHNSTKTNKKTNIDNK